jgi:sugar lactone lactonase YvrE
MRIARTTFIVLVTACSAGTPTSNATGPSSTGTVTGLVSSSNGGGLAGVHVIVTPTGSTALGSVTTSSSGRFVVPNVPVGSNGSGAISTSNLPSGCTTATHSYSSLAAGDTVAVTVTANCVAPVGSLQLTITPPAVGAAQISIHGPNGYTNALSQSATLTGLAPGTYTVTAPATDTATGTIVNTIYSATITGSPATVTGGTTASVAVTYGTAGTGELWVSNSAYSNTLWGFTAAQLTSSGTPTPASTVNISTASNAIAFDANGNAWVSEGSTEIIEFTAAQLAAGGTQSPSVTIRGSGALQYPAGLAFDRNGNLWVSSSAAVIEYTPSQLTSSGSPTPAIVVTSPQISTAKGIAFDHGGNLWVADVGAGTVESFNPAALSAGGSQTASVVITVPVPSLSVPTMPTYLAFDAAGNLWVATVYNTVLEYQTSQLATSGAPTPAITLSLPAGTGVTPNGLAFDNSYNLWVASYGLPTTVMEFTPAQIHTGGAQTPTVTLTESGVVNYSIGLAFRPHASFLPLH